MTKFLFCTVLLFAPFTHAMDRDSRPDIVMIMGTVLFTAGLYVACNSKAQNTQQEIGEAVFAVVTTWGGVWTVMNAHEIIKKFDEGR